MFNISRYFKICSHVQDFFNISRFALLLVVAQDSSLDFKVQDTRSYPSLRPSLLRRRAPPPRWTDHPTSVKAAEEIEGISVDHQGKCEPLHINCTPLYPLYLVHRCAGPNENSTRFGTSLSLWSVSSFWFLWCFLARGTLPCRSVGGRILSWSSDVVFGAWARHDDRGPEYLDMRVTKP